MSLFNLNLRPMMDEEGAGGGAVSSQTSTSSSEGTQSTSSGEQTGSATGTEGTQGNEVTSGGTESAPQQKQTPEQNAAFADLRRKSEAAERRAAELETKYQRDIDIAKKYGSQYGIYSDVDVASKYEKSHGIKTVAEFEAALQRQEYESKGIDPDVIKKIVDDHPDIKKAREANEAAEKSRQDRYLVDSFNELKTEYPDIKDVEDVPSEVWKKWQGGTTGLSLMDSFYLVNRKEIMAKQTDAAKQATLNNIQSKNHVRGNGAGSEIDTTTIPDDVLSMYKKFNPGKTMDEYKAHYKNSF